LALHSEVILYTSVAKEIGLYFVVFIALSTANPKASVIEVCDLKLPFAFATTAIFKIDQHWFLPFGMNEPQLRERQK
jgi:hypothetical protein